MMSCISFKLLIMHATYDFSEGAVIPYVDIILLRCKTVFTGSVT